ncbi:zinc-binding protein A33-like [Labrus bergylta]|uniref:zinc-binding protein A33-like n=1 Tax=Labrus bergylta TaxID=56723 RepID=UPI003314163F
MSVFSASDKMFSQTESDFSCPVCQDIFKDPVVLLCSHSFCKDCLPRWWRQKPMHECPVCKEISFLSNPPPNLALRNLCEAFLQQRAQKASAEAEALCSLHSEKLRLFCLDHHQPMCLVCRDSKEHNNHKFRPIDEAAKDHREEIQKSLKPLQDKMKIFEKVKANCDQTADLIKIQTLNTVTQIKEQFKKLHQFLQEEEDHRISALKEEEKQKSQKMKEKIKSLNRERAALSDTIRATEDELRADDISFLQNYKAAVKRVKQLPLPGDPELVSGALIDEAKHLGNLTFNIWNKMKEFVSYTPVILDPNSAHPHLILSEDLTGVSHGDRQELPDNPERFDFCPCVLSSEGFDSGSHSWEAEVINDQLWAVGVIQESVRKKGEIQSGCWALCYLEGQYRTFSPPLPDRVFSVKTKPQRIRVHLDFNRGNLSFWDPDTNTLLHTFRHTFTERLFPYVGTQNKLPLKISPLKVSVSVKQPSLHTFSSSFRKLFRS